MEIWLRRMKQDLKVKVLSITSLFPNCINRTRGIFVLNRLKALSKYADIEVIAPIPWFPFFKNGGGPPFFERIEGIKVYHPKFFSIPKFFKSLDGLFFYLSLKKFRKKAMNSDIIDSHLGWPDSYGAWLFSRKYRKKFSVTLRGSDVHFWAKQKSTSHKIKNMIFRSEKVISVSKELKMLVKRKDVEVISNGVDLEQFVKVSKVKAREKIGADGRKKIILAVGNSFFRKGFFDLVSAIAELDSKEILLLIVGKDKPRVHSRIVSKIDRLNLGKRIKLIGKVDNDLLKYYYSAADISVLASYKEGWPNVLMESLACGTPCVVTKEAGGEFITDSLGIVTSRRDLAKNIKKALDKKWDTKKILKFAKENSWDKTARKLFSSFEKVIKS